MVKKKSSRPTSKAKKSSTAGTAVKLSNKQKNEFLEPYLNRLLALKAEQEKNNKQLLPRNAISDVVATIRSHGVQWVNEALLKKKLSRIYKKDKEEQQRHAAAVVELICPPPPGTTEDATSTIASPSFSTPTKNTKAGRKLSAETEHLHKCITEARNKICDLYYAEYLKAKVLDEDGSPALKKNKRCENKVFQDIFNEVKRKRNLPDNFSFTYSAVMNRIYRKTIDSPNLNKVSPLHQLEATFVELISRIADTGVPLSVGECILFINSTIQGTIHQQRLIEYKRIHFPKDYLETKTDADLGQVGRNYWRGFLKRNKNVLASMRGKKFESQRVNWTKYRFFRTMYDDIERVMVEAGVAKQLESPQWMNEHGHVVVDEINGCGMKCTAQLIEPSCVLVLDEAGADTAMVSDGHAGGRKMVRRKGKEVRQRVTKKAKRFTVIPLLALTGEAVMCVIIVDGSERNSFIESGIDIFKASEYEYFEDIGLSDFVDNFGDGQIFPGGPVCKFCGKEVPCMVRMKKGGGIDGMILVDIFKTLDTLGVYDDTRARGVNPVIILDGHQSRFKLPFLNYITDDLHRWHCCIGVPYGTALWQVNDAEECNGKFKFYITLAKEAILKKRIETFTSDLELLPTDIIPMVNKAWNSSFANSASCKRAITFRGWNPLNRNLLLHQSLRPTLTEEDKEWERGCGLHPYVRFQHQQQEKEAALALLPSTQNSSTTNTQPSYADPTTLNFSQGYAAVTLERLAGHDALEKARAKNDENRLKGNNIRELFASLKRFTAGNLIKSIGTHELGKDLVYEMKKRAAAEEAKEEAKQKSKDNTHRELMLSFCKLLQKKPSESKWSVSDFRMAVRAFKEEDDRFRVPGKKDELIKLWGKLRPRAAGVEPLPLPPINEEHTTTSTACSNIVQPGESNLSNNGHNEMTQEVFAPLTIPHADLVEDLTDESNLIGLASICAAELKAGTVGEAV